MKLGKALNGQVAGTNRKERAITTRKRETTAKAARVVGDDLPELTRCRHHQVATEKEQIRRLPADDRLRIYFNNNVFIRQFILPLPALTNLI